MANEREVFTIVEDDLTGAGVSLPARIEGQSPASKNGIIGFSFKDSAGNLVLPSLSATGGIPIDEAGICKKAAATALATVGTPVDVATLTLVLTKNYAKVDLVLSSTQTCLWQLVYIDDAAGTPVETVLLSVITGSGQFHYANSLPCLVFDTIGGTGVQELVVRGTQLRGDASDLHAFVGVKEN